MTEPTPESTDAITRLLADRIGLDPASVGENLIRTGVRNRMRQLGLRQIVDYERVLRGPTDEVQALIEEVVIPESWFFRDDRPFAAFRAVVRSGWVERPERAPLTVLCLPCAGGEEPYSVVMTLLDLGLPRERFEVVAVDVSERSIHRAARGVYGINSFRGVSDSVRDRFFDPAETPGRFLVRAPVRAGVRFERGNILDEGLLATSGGFAIVFCRNLLIYFDDDARARAARNLDRLTATDGFLFLGHADRPDPLLLARFGPYAEPGSFLYRRRDSAALSPGLIAPPGVGTADQPAPSIRATPPARPRPVPRPGPATLAGASPAPWIAVPALAPVSAPPRPRPLAPLAPVLPTVDTPGAASTGSSALEQAANLADRGEYAAAADLVRHQLGQGPLDAPAHFLLGMIHQAAGDRAQAEAELLKAVYLDAEHDEALLALALLARRRGDVAAEALWRRRAERVRVRKGRL